MTPAHESPKDACRPDEIRRAEDPSNEIHPRENQQDENQSGANRQAENQKDEYLSAHRCLNELPPASRPLGQVCPV